MPASERIRREFAGVLFDFAWDDGERGERRSSLVAKAAARSKRDSVAIFRKIVFLFAGNFSRIHES
jgi:hypothetical protein